MRSSRRANYALEFAFTLPIYGLLLSGIADYGWYFDRRTAITLVARDAARAASVTDPEEGDPKFEGEAQGEASLQRSGLEGTVECTVVGESPDERVECAVEAPFVPIIGLAPVDRMLRGGVTMRLQEQS